MSKSYPSKVDMPGMSPKIQKASVAKAKTEASKPAEDPGATK